MNSQNLNNEWFEMAKMDLDAAEYLLNMRPVPIEIICYHCEQSAEKMLKGVLVANNIEPPKTHDLLQLCKQCSEIDEEYEQFSDSCIELTPYGVQVRYPSGMELDEMDMHCALREARKIFEFVTETLISPDEDAEQEPGLTL